jgi:hypothetical protein
VELFDHLGSEYTEDRAVGEAGSMSDGFSDTSLSQAGSAEAKDVAMFSDEAAAQKLFDHTGIQFGPCCEVKALETLDGANVRALEAAF